MILIEWNLFWLKSVTWNNLIVFLYFRSTTKAWQLNILSQEMMVKSIEREYWWWLTTTMQMKGDLFFSFIVFYQISNIWIWVQLALGCYSRCQWIIYQAFFTQLLAHNPLYWEGITCTRVYVLIFVCFFFIIELLKWVPAALNCSNKCFSKTHLMCWLFCFKNL